MRGISSLANEPRVEVFLAIGINLILAVRLIVILALATILTRVNLRTATHALSNLGERHLGTDAQDLSHNLVPDGERVRAVAPVAADLVSVAGADTAALDLEIDVIVAKRSGLPRVLFEILPVVERGRLEALELFGDRHGCGGVMRDADDCSVEVMHNVSSRTVIIQLRCQESDRQGNATI